MLKDVDRKLNERGLSDAPFMAIQLKESGIVPDLIISSHAKRALSTAHYFAQEFSIAEADVIIEKNLYHGDIEEFINTIMLSTSIG